MDEWSPAPKAKALILQWRRDRKKANLKSGDAVPENMLHLVPALTDLFRRYPETISIYNSVLEEVFTTYRNALHPKGYGGFPGETFSTWYLVEQYVWAQEAGLNIVLPSHRPIELMVEH